MCVEKKLYAETCSFFFLLLLEFRGDDEEMK